MPLTESQFVEEVQNSGVLVYLSGAWLCELYQQVIAQSPLPIIQRKFYLRYVLC